MPRDFLYNYYYNCDFPYIPLEYLPSSLPMCFVRSCMTGMDNCKLVLVCSLYEVDIKSWVSRRI